MIRARCRLALASLVLCGLGGAPGAARAQVDFELKDPVDAYPGTAPAGTLKGHEKFVFSVAFSPDGKLLATAGEDTAAIWDAATGRRLRALSPGETEPPGAYAVAFAPDGKTLAVGGYIGHVYFYDPATGELKGTFKEPSLSSPRLAYAPDGSTLAVGHDQGSVMLYDVKAGKLLDTLKSPEKSGTLAGFDISGDGKTLVVTAREGVLFWDLPARKLRKAIGHDPRDARPDALASFDAVACSPVAPAAAISGGAALNRKTTFFNLKTLRPAGGLAFQGAGVPNITDEPTIKVLRFSPDGKVLASGPASGIRDRTPVSLWDATTGRRIAALTGSTEGITEIAYSADGRRLAASSFNKLVYVWDIPAAATGAAETKGKAKAARAKSGAKKPKS